MLNQYSPEWFTWTFEGVEHALDLSCVEQWSFDRQVRQAVVWTAIQHRPHVFEGEVAELFRISMQGYMRAEDPPIQQRPGWWSRLLGRTLGAMMILVLLEGLIILGNPFAQALAQQLKYSPLATIQSIQEI